MSRKAPTMEDVAARAAVVAVERAVRLESVDTMIRRTTAVPRPVETVASGN